MDGTGESMNIIYFLMPLALLLGAGFVGAFIYSVRKGQFDDLETPAHRMLLDEKSITTKEERKQL
jgi:cbb3-type cytochrome oxidase maturation protein